MNEFIQRNGFYGNSILENYSLQTETQADTHSNIQVMITSFDYKEQDGTRDVYYNISLTECIDIKINKTSQANNNSNNNTNRPTENNPSSNKKIHKVVKGDSLWAIAQKYYGNGSKYPQIKELLCP